MKAIILAAGKGERLGNLVNSMPKPMIKVKGKPILEYNIELCKKYGLTDIFINVHHLSNYIMDYFGDGSMYGVNITYSIENVLFGTSGAVKQIAKSFWNYDDNNALEIHSQDFSTIGFEPFFVLYGDNLSDYNLNNIKEKGNKTKAIATIGFHYREDVTSSGVADFDAGGRVLSFIEKPKDNETTSHWVNAGIYYLMPHILNHIPEGHSDFAQNVFPSLLMKKISIYGVCDNTDVKAFDTIEMLNKNISNLNKSL